MNATRTVAAASMVAFATQVVFALLMLRLFTPEEVGDFSVISQVAFLWMTLALAQAPLTLLADHNVPAHIGAQHAWRASLVRYAGLLPIAALSLWLSQLTLWPTLLWAALLAFCQIGWMLAQSFTLRMGNHWQQASVRVLPPLVAALTALCMTLLQNTEGWTAPTLVLSALLGYAIGAAWLAPVLQAPPTAKFKSAEAHTHAHSAPSDSRSTSLRMAHTLVDATLATAVVVVWQRLYGAEDTGWMMALLRVLGFLPAVVHMAWAQVALAQGDSQQAHVRGWHNPWRLGLAAFGCVIGLGLSCALALSQEWLDLRWQGVWPYIAPLVLWQGCACLSAAFSHRPFQTQTTRHYSWACMGLGVVQAFVLLLPMGWDLPIDATQHIATFALTSSVGLLGLTVWMARLR